MDVFIYAGVTTVDISFLVVAFIVADIACVYNAIDVAISTAIVDFYQLRHSFKTVIVKGTSRISNGNSYQSGEHLDTLVSTISKHQQRSRQQLHIHNLWGLIISVHCN